METEAVGTPERSNTCREDGPGREYRVATAPARPLSRLAPWLDRCRAELGYRSGLYRLAARSHAGLGVIFMLHRVIRPGQPTLYPGYAIALDALEDALRTCLRLGWEAIPLDEVEHRLAGRRAARRFVCFTFDDGYADNLELALPLFRKYEIPFTVSLLPAALNRSLFYWWGGLEELIWTHDRIEIPSAAGAPAMRLMAGSFAEKRAAYDKLDALCHQPGSRLAPVLGGVFERHGVDVGRLLERDFLSMKQARELAADPLVSIASHGATHRRLADLDETEVRRELEESRGLLEQGIGVRVRHLVYPYGGHGACGRREFALAREAGYRTACTTRRGNIFAAHREHAHCLPRREVPLNRAQSIERLFGMETILRGQPRFQTD